MNIRECAQVLAKIQLVDNRGVDEAVILDWMDYIGDVEFAAAIAAVVKFRRERPDDYLQPGHIVEYSGGVADESGFRDIQEQLEAEWKQRELAGEKFVDVEAAPQWAKPYEAGDLE